MKMDGSSGIAVFPTITLVNCANARLLINIKKTIANFRKIIIPLIFP
jgi:hypothetical protein